MPSQPKSPLKQALHFATRHLVFALLTVFPAQAAEEAKEEPAPPESAVIEVERPFVADTAFYEKTSLVYNNNLFSSDEQGERLISVPTVRVDFEADQYIVESTPSGYAKALVIHIQKFIRTPLDEEGGESATCLKPGTIVYADAVDKETTEFLVDGEVIEDESTVALLDDLIGLTNEDPDVSHTETLLLGEKHPRKPGERWKLDSKKLAKLMSSPDWPLAPEDASGYAIYLGEFDVDDVPCHRIAYTHNLRFTRDITERPTLFSRRLEIDLPLDNTQVERSFKMRRWTRVDQQFNKRQLLFPATRSTIYQLDYETDLRPIQDEELLGKLRKALTDHKAAVDRLEAEPEDETDENSDNEADDAPPADEVEANK